MKVSDPFMQALKSGLKSQKSSRRHRQLAVALACAAAAASPPRQLLYIRWAPPLRRATLRRERFITHSEYYYSIFCTFKIFLWSILYKLELLLLSSAAHFRGTRQSRAQRSARSTACVSRAPRLTPCHRYQLQLSYAALHISLSAMNRLTQRLACVRASRVVRLGCITISARSIKGRVQGLKNRVGRAQ
eukprot:6189313-Pleurochrysis_carterae.AAC.1